VLGLATATMFQPVPVGFTPFPHWLSHSPVPYNRQ
jgi:hypothetical protein